MNVYQYADIAHIERQLVQYPAEGSTGLVTPAGHIVGVVYPLSPTAGVIVLDPMKPYGRPVVFECQYTDLVNKLRINPRVRLIGG